MVEKNFAKWGKRISPNGGKVFKISFLQYMGIDYYNGVVRSDINRADGVQKDPERVKRLMPAIREHRYLILLSQKI